MSGHTAATSPTTTPELAQMTRMMSASKGIGTIVECSPPSLVGPPVESVEYTCEASAESLHTNRSREQTTFDHSGCAPVAVPYLSPRNAGRRKLDSDISPPLFQEGDIISAKAPENGTFAASGLFIEGYDVERTSKEP